MEGIRYWIETEGAGHWFFIAFPVALLCLFIWFKGSRVRFLIPSLIISLVIINPLFYKYWDELGLYAYWRILWVVPVIPVVAGLVPSITDKLGKTWIKAVVAAFGVGLIVFGGTFLYNGAGGSFVEAANAAKLPDYVVNIADRLLELDDHPSIIAQDPIGVYIRQYTGDIDTLYGRDISQNYIYKPSDIAWRVNGILGDPENDIQIVSQIMLDEGYDYLVYRGDTGEGFELVDIVGEYGIYRPVGFPTVLKERNELGQVIKQSFIDHDGVPYNNENGYSTTVTEYDNTGEIALQYYYDKDGNQVEMGSGVLHEYLSSLMGRSITIFISIKDDATRGLTNTIISDLRALGIKTNLRDCYRQSYYAVIVPHGVQEEAGDKALSFSGKANGITFTVESEAFEYGNYSSIFIDGVEYSKNMRGLNIVVYDNERGIVQDSINFDTFLDFIPSSR